MVSENTERWDMVPIGKLIEAPNNPWHGREDVTELAASIDELGILQPLLVRPSPTRKGYYEVVCGNRRRRGAELAGLTDVPVIVRELTDRQAIEAQLVENGSRADVHPIEECGAFERLMGEHGYSADDIAAKIGKSRSHVYARLKYASLGAASREAFLAGTVTPSVALILARIPSPALQDKVLKQITDGVGDPLSTRRVADYVRREFMLGLKEAPFSAADTELVPEAGACTSCPKRTGNQAELFADVDSPDVCTDPDCYASKRAAHGKRLVELHKSKGGEVLTKAKSKEIFPDKWHRSPRGYIDLREKPSWEHVDDPSKNKKSWKGLIGADVEVVLAHDQDGNVRELVPAPIAKKLLKANHPKLVAKPPTPRGKTAAERRKDAERKLELEVRAVWQDAVLAELVEQAGHPEAVHGADTWRVVARGLLSDWGGGTDVAQDVCRRRGIEYDRKSSWRAATDTLTAELSQMDEPALIGLVIELICRTDMESNDTLSDRDETSIAAATCTLFEVDFGFIRNAETKRARAAAEASKAAKKRAPKKAAKKKTAAKKGASK